MTNVILEELLNENKIQKNIDNIFNNIDDYDDFVSVTNGSKPTPGSETRSLKTFKKEMLIKLATKVEIEKNGDVIFYIKGGAVRFWKKNK